MKTTWLAFSLIAVLLCSCATTPPPPKNVPRHDALPEKLKLVYAGDAGRTEFLFENGAIVRHAYHPTDRGEKLVNTEYFVPTREQWLAFWKRAHQIQVWSWKTSYDPQDIGKVVFDGASWHLVLKYRGREIDTGGSNAGPKPGQPQKTTTDWDLWNKPLDDAMSILVPYREE